MSATTFEPGVGVPSTNPRTRKLLQGAGRLLWPPLGGLCLMLMAIGGGGLAPHLTGSLQRLSGSWRW